MIGAEVADHAFPPSLTWGKSTSARPAGPQRWDGDGPIANSRLSSSAMSGFSQGSRIEVFKIRSARHPAVEQRR
jgi:hypothetical protein